MKKLLLLVPLLGMVACGQPEPRKPIKASGNSFLKESAARSKKLLEREEGLIRTIIAADTTHVYNTSGEGSWYFYLDQNESGLLAEPDDLVTLTYDIVSLENDTIYSQQEIGIIQYKVDKQELFPGLRNSVKLLRENERATFLFTSPMAFGYPGDKERIGTNVPIKSTIQILKVEKQSENNEE
ncbi:gliding motility-associated peptidyl-prolyl isomerase GldI [Lentiprolixibacter aurantiacus]|uniref:peptidylprolyl isomerase n=1 Tax=Lentiprolixibacter aurantiacus TaxID=2993939 RepID=A0AAE3MMB5_9FLAO|nr:gliding motility-associated peptidyl-prolyl isomerase GldI [Lentiprolixibacter aurantiacus]MCX2720425.1 gliding motility-associated peptidyl-prolyl isomerase GldI [Lentiprolixibacter aurantiacus]